MWLWSLSLSSFWYKRDMGYRKKWTHEGPSKKKKKKSWTHEGPWKKKRERQEKKEVAMLSKRIYKWRETTHKEFPSTIYHPLYPCTCTSRSDSMTNFPLWIWFMTLQYMWCKYAFSFIPTLKLHIWPSLEVGWRIWASQNALLRTYTPWVIREYLMRS